ncbi:MAG TPA: T9SS type A sorting domain-containing protein [Panacibacter sp.]|nr:T9SS type A sorting domain-containing protein [Panacibacter sp.]
MKLALLILFTCGAIAGYTQINSAIQWQKCVGGSSYDEARSIQQTKDGGYIMAGSSNSINGDISGNHGKDDYLVVKFDAAGTILWQKSLGGSSSEAAWSIQQTKDGGYIVGGTSYSNDGDVSGHHGTDPNSDYWIVKLDSIGTIQWQKSLGSPSGFFSGFGDLARSIQQTKDGGYIVAGDSWANGGDVSGNHGNGPDYWIVKLDSAGTILWQKSLGGSATENVHAIRQTIDGGYIVAGASFSNDGDVSGHHGDPNLILSSDYWIVKLDSAGAILWQKSLGGLSNEHCNDIQQTFDKGYIMFGHSNSTDGDVSGNHGNFDYWIVKSDSTGTIQWQKSFGGSNNEFGYSIRQTSDSGYILAGTSSSNDGDVIVNHGYEDYWIVKLDNTGGILWQKSLGGSNSDIPYCIQETSDDGYIIAGWTLSNNGDVSGSHVSDCWEVKLLSDGLLPVSLLQFNAVAQQNKKVLVYWKTSQEINNKFYSVEKSKDGIHFIAAGMVNANPTSQITNRHSFTDNTPFSGSSYYRLKQTDVNGKSTNSNIVAVKITNNEYSMSVQPNPSQNGIFTADFKETRKNISIIVTDNTGKKIYTNTLSSAEQIIISLNNKPKGIYYLRINYSGGTESAKLIIE